MPTASFSLWDIVRVPFPYTDRPIRQRRPALVVACGDLEREHGLLWVAMITSAENRGWPEDVAISDRTLAGLPVASLVRCAKIATIEARDADTVGTLGQADRIAVSDRLRRIMQAAVP